MIYTIALQKKASRLERGHEEQNNVTKKLTLSMCWTTALMWVPKTSPAWKNRCWQSGSLASAAPENYYGNKTSKDKTKKGQRMKTFGLILGLSNYGETRLKGGC